MRIGELSKFVDCPVETIRFYEAQKLLPAAERNISNYRVYGDSHVKRMKFILRCRSLDLSLEEIRQLIDISDHGDKDAVIAHEIVDKHLATIQQKLSEIKKLQSELKELRSKCSCQHESHDHCGLLEGLRDIQ